MHLRTSVQCIVVILVVGLSFKGCRAGRRGKEKEKEREAILRVKENRSAIEEGERHERGRWGERSGRKREEDSWLSQVLSCQHG